MWHVDSEGTVWEYKEMTRVKDKKFHFMLCNIPVLG